MVTDILRAELVRRGVFHAGRAERPQEHGMGDSDLNEGHKPSRDRDTAIFVTDFVRALGAELAQIAQAICEADRKGGNRTLAEGKRRKAD